MPTVNLADPRVKRTRQLIFAAFNEVLQHKAFHDITIQDITDQATLNRGTFYDHFTDKFELLDHFLREQFHRYLDARLPTMRSWSPRQLSAFVLAILDFVVMVHHDCRPSDREFDPIAQQIVIEELEGIFQRWFRDPAFPVRLSDATSKTAAAVWSWSIFGTAQQWNQKLLAGTAQDVTERLTQLLLHAVAVPA